MSKASKKVTKETNTVELTAREKCAAEVKNFEAGTSKSEMIRALHANGYAKADIAAALGVRYQHVRNVLITPLKRPAAGK